MEEQTSITWCKKQLDFSSKAAINWNSYLSSSVYLSLRNYENVHFVLVLENQSKKGLIQIVQIHKSLLSSEKKK